MYQTVQRYGRNIVSWALVSWSWEGDEQHFEVAKLILRPVIDELKFPAGL